MVHFPASHVSLPEGKLDSYLNLPDAVAMVLEVLEVGATSVPAMEV